MADPESTAGASNNERLLSAAREDNEDLLLEIFEEGKFDINYQDGLGNTALHYAASLGNTTVLEHILSHDGCDVDPINRLERATPLHLALQLEDQEVRAHVIESLLEAGADFSIKDKNNETVLDLLGNSESDLEIRKLIRKAQAQASVSHDDVASDDDDGEPGSGSGSE